MSGGNWDPALETAANVCTCPASSRSDTRSERGGSIRYPHPSKCRSVPCRPSGGLTRRGPLASVNRKTKRAWVRWRLAVQSQKRLSATVNLHARAASMITTDIGGIASARTPVPLLCHQLGRLDPQCTQKCALLAYRGSKHGSSPWMAATTAGAFLFSSMRVSQLSKSLALLRLKCTAASANRPLLS